MTAQKLQAQKWPGCNRPGFDVMAAALASAMLACDDEQRAT